jgi:hypothetical protein
LYRAIYNNGSRTIVIEDMTFKQGKNVSWNGGLIYNASGTMTFNRIKISNHSSWAFYQGGGGVTTFNNSQFNNNGYAITSDHGGTPSALSLTDTDYSNRIYVNDSTFTSNTYGIRTERFVKINNSQFTGNTQVGAYLGGLNRQQVLNSTFTSNGVGVYFSSWIPTSWPVGAGNQTVSGNTFNGNTTAIQFANNWNDGSSAYNGVSANSFSTASGNTFGTTALNTNNFSGSGYVESNNTITAAYLNPVTNLTAVANADGSVDLDWDASEASNTAIYGYSVSFYDLTVIGGATSGGWGVWTNQGTNYSLSTEMFSGSNPVTTGYGPVRFGIKAGNQSCFSNAGVGPCVYGTEVTIDATVIEPASATTSTTTTTTAPGPVYTDPVDTNPVYTEPINTNPVYIEPIDTEPVYTEPIDTDPVYTEPIDTDPVYTEPIDTDPVYTEPIDTDPVYTEPIDTDPIETTDFTDEEINNIIDNIDTASSEAIAAVLDDIFTSDISAGQLAEVLGAVFTADVTAEVFVAAFDAVLVSDISAEEFAAVLDAVFDEPLSDEQFTAVIDSVITEDITDEQFAEVLNVLESDTVSEEQVAEAVDAVLENGVTEDQATNLASSSKVLESIDTAQAEAVFETIPVGDLTQAEEAALVAAVTDAPEEIKNTFEETIDIYGEGLDDYVAVGSQVDVGSRRTLIAATTAVAGVVGAAATGGASGGSTGGSGGGSGGSGSTNSQGRSKREEEGNEPAGEIAGGEEDENGNFTKNSIFKYKEGTMERKFSPWGFIKKFAKETAGLSFTLAGSVVVFITLSGDTRKIAMIATGVALAVHYTHRMLQNDED